MPNLKMSSLPKRVALVYLAFSLLWIFGSDWVVSHFSVEMQQYLQTIKGWVFVIATSALIYVLLLRPCFMADELQTRLSDTASELTESSHSKQALFDAIPISLWEEDFSQVKKYIDNALAATGLDIRAWLDEYPQELIKLAGMVKVISVGGSTLEMFGALSENELVSNLNQIFSNDSLPAFREELICFYMGGRHYHVEAEQKRLDGKPIMTSTTAAIVPGYEQSWSRVIVAIEDITDRVNALQAVNSFFEQPMNLHVIGKLDGTILRINEGWTRSLGYTPDEVIGRQFFEFVHPEEKEQTVQEVRRLGENENTHYFDNRCRDKSGEYHSLSWSAVCPEGSELVYAVAVDMTERLRAERKLKDAASVYRYTSEGILLTDLDGTIRDVNDAFTSITGYEKEDVVGQNARLLRSGRHDRSFYQTMWHGIAETGHWRGEIWNRKKDGSVYPEYLTISAVKDDEHQVNGYVGVFSDISSIKQTEHQIAHLSTHDPLTELPNRALLDERLKHAIRHAAREGHQLAVVLFDLDNFKQLNDSLGFTAGDELLKQLANRLVATVRADDTVARISGDEFALILEGIEYSKQSVVATEKLLSVLNEPFELGGQKILVSASLGVSLYPSDGDTHELLIRNADAALSQAKRTGRNNYQFYTEALTAEAYEYLFYENALRSALEKEEFYLVYQPQFSLATTELVGMEVLLRWQHPEQGLISPGVFIPIAERAGLISGIGEWVLREACKQALIWHQQGYNTGRIAVNVAGPQIARGDLPQVVEKVLHETGLPASLLALEVTESFVMDRTEDATAQLNALRDMGIEIAIDDFGTGYSSLSYLKKLPIDKLKIDQSFVAELGNSEDDLAIAEAVIALSKALKLKTIAEGVETEQQAMLLTEKGCAQVQGFLYSKPIPAEEVERFCF